MPTDIDAEALAQRERDTWSRCAEHYLTTFAGLTSQAVPFLVELGELQPGSVVLELGAGPGHIAQALAAVGATVTGVDFSPQMVAAARQHYPALRFHEADAEQVPIASTTCDAVVANFVVHHLARPTVVFREVQRVFKPGGRFVFATFGPLGDQSSFAVFLGALQGYHTLDPVPTGPLFGLTERDAYEPLIIDAGLTALRLELRQVVWRTATLGPVLQGFWEQTNLTTLPQATRQQVEAAAQQAAQSYWQAGQFAFPHTLLLGSARKPY